MPAEVSPNELNDRIDHLGAMFEKVIQVNSFFITAGYGTFFGVWAITRDTISADARVWSCLFLLGSASLFMFWHIYSLLSMNAVVRAIDQEPAEGWARRFGAALRKKNGQIIQRLGIPITLLAAGLGAIGVLILGVGLLRSL